MPKFLTRAEIYRLIQRELPEDVYADGAAPSAFYTTADVDASACVVGSVYSNMERVYENFWAQSADERIGDWEETVFGRRQDAASLTLSQRRLRVLTKLRTRRSLSKPDLIDLIKGIIGTDKLVEIREWGCETGSWIIGESQLGIETILGGGRKAFVVAPDMCGVQPSDFGMTLDEWNVLLEEIFTYEVLIYGYTLSASERDTIDAELSRAEPGRSTHVITDGLNPADMIEV